MSMDLAKKLYAKMPDACAKAKAKFGRALTLAEKILVSHADNFETQTWERGKAMLFLRPDRVAMSSNSRKRDISGGIPSVSSWRWRHRSSTWPK